MSQAQVDTGYKQCYCNGQYREFGYTDQSCQSLCGSPSRPTKPHSDGFRPRQEEPGRKRQQELERRQKEERAREQEFQDERRKLCGELKGGNCEDLDAGLKSGRSGDLELKDVGNVQDGALHSPGLEGRKPHDTEIKPSFRARVRRHWADGSGSPGLQAWTQLHCGAYLFGKQLQLAQNAIANRDLETVAYFGDEVIGALEGREYGELCPAAPKMPGTGLPPREIGVKFYSAMVKAAERDARRIVAGSRSDKVGAQRELEALKKLSSQALQNPESMPELLRDVPGR